ncbi:MAG TPA: MBL fold metallo-hydrolase [Gaiellaceae bacterium]|nr:MBL fold metallo-hydrolase [Gaiellaceae bacterium]
MRTARLAARFDPLLARVTWIGHSTVLLELDGVRLLTDPVLRPRVLHLRRVAAQAAEVGAVDAILISHGHYDHLDSKSLARFDRATRVIAPKRVRGFANVVEVAAGDEVQVGAVTVTATPAEHVRGSVGFLVTGSARIYFAGDTDLFDGMRELAPVDVALLPIAGWGPRLPPGHLDPARAARALELLRPRLAVPIHWGTYTRVGLERDEQEPARRFAQFAADFDVRVLPVGGSVDIPVAAAVR